MYRLINSFFLVVCFFLIFCGSSHNLKFSKKYIPIYNPGGEYFFNDQKFSKSYELYDKRRDALREKAAIGNYNSSSKVVPKNQSVNQYRPSGPTEDITFIDNDDAMVNNYGIDIARLKGAKFIQVMDDNDYYHDDQKKEKQRPSFTTFSHKIKAEFDKASHDIALKMKNLSKKKSTNFNRPLSKFAHNRQILEDHEADNLNALDIIHKDEDLEHTKQLFPEVKFRNRFNNQNSIVNFNNYNSTTQYECDCSSNIADIEEKSDRKSTGLSSIED